MSKPCVRNQMELKETVIQGRTLAGPMGKRSGSRKGQGASSRRRHTIARPGGKRLARERKVKGIGPYKAPGGLEGGSVDIQKCAWM
jgi:hypothetical protein